ncbi:hypothetical protein D9V41_09065 [Aeromicrobium phragmitis]|uniref:ImmA/IrrE family metallo-endopeptidase n=1 Tax=Aeromicrobium phragmitis TaxID=2478914 RepID=A0A3L8PND4_9ACTN|nr:hypothetical protein [Aeromicrobium phragmitis]RLV56028.1 hypothetical protein D9V41_09065 [Aeromicrobium phragmitis]
MSTSSKPHPHPWAEWAKFPHIRIWWRHDLPDHVLGKTDGVRNVWHNIKALQVERRCSTRHEQEHILAGHDGCQEGRVEALIQWRAAKWLCPNPHDVADAIVWADGDLHLAADHLWLDMTRMEARLDRRFMHPAEARVIEKKCSEELHP